MRAKSCFVGLLLVFTTTLSGLCMAGDLASGLVGKWQARTRSGNEVFQFFSGGTATSYDTDQPQAVMTWSYAVLDDGHIKLENEGPIRSAKVLEAGIAGDVLTLSQNGTIIGRYTRIQ